jgi:hypothetical protein
MDEQPTLVEVCSLNFQLNNRSFLFSPSDDITAKEVCLILQMILNVFAQKGNVKIDLESFIEKHNLMKHFTEVKNEGIDIHG